MSHAIAHTEESPIVAPILTSTFECESCPIGCSSDFSPVEFCPLVPRKYPTGSQLATLGEPINYLWFVKSGLLAGTFGPGREAHVVFQPGSLVGLEALVGNTSLATVWALSRTSVCAIAKGAFDGWLARRSVFEDSLHRAAQEFVAIAAHQNG